MVAIAVNGLTKVYGGRVTAVADVDATVNDGEFVALLGPTGCGKTTTLRLIAGLEAPTAGQVHLDGRDVTRVPTSRRRIAMVVQDGALYPHLNVRDNIGFPLRMEPVTASVGAERIQRAAQLTGVGALLAQQPGQLSGGERQRVALARALVRHPLALLLDEPLSQVDAPARALLRVAIVELTRRMGLGTLCVTHDQSAAMGLADRVLVMRRGRIEQAGPPAQVYDDPATLFVAAFLGIPQTSLLQGAVYAEPEVATVIDLGDQAIRLPWSQPLGRGLGRHHGARVVVAIRADAAAVTASTTPGAITGRVTAVQQVGAHTHAWLEIGAIPPALSPSELELVEAPAERPRIPTQRTGSGRRGGADQRADAGRPASRQPGSGESGGAWGELNQRGSVGQRTGDSLRHALGRLVPHGSIPARLPTARTTYGFYPVYDYPVYDHASTPAPEVNLTGTVIVRIPPGTVAPGLGDPLTCLVDPARVFLFDHRGTRLRP
jgi:multiple sugar transport system ATP-binding protein